ncbi:MAG: ABC transporter permease [Chloroflexota bacterium]
MINLMWAEWLKLKANRWVALFTIAILPLGTFILLNILAGLAIVNIWQPEMMTINWQEQIILGLLFANQLISQTLFIILGAITFGGEYRWQTWKNIIPRTSRVKLVLSKYFIIMLAMLVAIHSMALMTLIGSWEISLALNIPFVSGAWNEVSTPFVQQYLWLTIALFFNYSVATLYAVIVTIITRSTVAGIILGVLIAFGDLLSQSTFDLVASLMSVDAIAVIPRILPNYNVQNMMQWIISGATFENWSLGLSFVLLSIWISIGISASTILFGRQDIH